MVARPPTADPARMDDAAPVRVLIVDDHPALQSGLHAVISSQPGFVALGVASDENGLWPRYNAAKPDLVLMDYHLPGEDGLVLCHRLKAKLTAPRVVVYSAYADSDLAVPAALAGADALLNKGVPANELFTVLSRVMAGERMLPPLRDEARERALARLPGDEAQAARLLLDDAAPADVAAAIGVEPGALGELVESALRRLGLDVPTASLS